jgi:hypothetical protein
MANCAPLPPNPFNDDGKTVKKDCLREGRGIALLNFCYEENIKRKSMF